MTPRPFILRRCAAALLVLCAHAVACAEVLTHDEAVRLALERAPAVHAQQLAVDSAQSTQIAAGRLPDPQLIFGVDNLPATGTDAWSLASDFMTMRKVGLMQSFPNRRKREAQRERAAAAVSVAQSQSRELQLQIARSVADAWVTAQAAELALTKLRQLEPEVSLQAEAARVALANARGSTVDALAAQSDRSELADRILEAQRNVRAARADLAQWIGEDADRPLPAALSFRTLPVPREQLLTSLHRHAELLTFEARKALAQSEVDAAVAEKHADWSTEISYSTRGPAFSDMVAIEFRVGLPLFSRDRQNPLIVARRADLSRLDSERETALRMHTAEVRSAIAAWDAARSRIELYENERLPLARARSQAALAGFQASKIELTALLASHAAEFELQRSYADLVRELGQAWVYLRYLDIQQELP